MKTSKFDADFLAKLTELGDPLPALWTDSFEYLKVGMKARGRNTAIERQMLRVSVLMAAAAFEGFVNYVAGNVLSVGTVNGHRLTEFEIDCLSERRKVLERGQVKEKNQIYSTKERLLLLIHLFSHSHAYNKQNEADLDWSLKVRDQIVHPKPAAIVELDERAVMGFYTSAAALFLVWEVSDLIGASKRPLSDFTPNHSDEAVSKDLPILPSDPRRLQRRPGSARGP